MSRFISRSRASTNSSLLTLDTEILTITSANLVSDQSFCVRVPACRIVKVMEGLAVVGATAAGGSLHLAESSAPVGSGGGGIDSQTARVASRAWAMLLRPFLQLGVGILWSTSVWAAAGREDEQGHSPLHPLLVYLIPAGLGSVAVWFALDIE